ncbi:ATP-dependent RNA helicase DDX55 [Dirofilaria immitis]|nr:ATP-dependent RNA helicase DDX55 [Dirofilaria immitis]
MSFSDYWVLKCQRMREDSDYRWGDYYLSGGRKGKKSWVLELIHTANQMIPTFNELFDEETFYVFAFIVVISSFLIALFLAKVVGIRIREYPLNVDREWRDARPANPFRFPWNQNGYLLFRGEFYSAKNLTLIISVVVSPYFNFCEIIKSSVREQTIERLLKFQDVIVQAPTGSGKTLAYILPVFTLLWNKKQVWPENEIGAVIIVPCRELAKQVDRVCKSFADALSLNTRVMIGGKRKIRFKNDPLSKSEISIFYPNLIAKNCGESKLEFQKALKALEILIIDEADRYADSSFKASMTEILESLLKQRRTGLFSATQAKEMEEMVKFGLRNPIQITITNCGAVLDSVDSVKSISPNTLNNFHMACGESRSELQNFRRIGKSVMLCTDVLSRGIDVDNIDWVVQFDIPKQTSWFVHRAGRSARCGKVGNNVLFLTPEETAYIKFIEKYEKVSLTEMKANLKENDDGAEQIRQQIVEIASKEREILESGTRAFMSFVESYVHHDCNVVCSYKDLDVIGYGHAYGLLRLPRMKEFHHSDLSDFKRSDLNTSEIPYKNAEKEKQRQEKLLLLKNEDKPMKKDSEKGLDARQVSKNSARKRRHTETKENIDDLGSDFALLKKLKKED